MEVLVSEGGLSYRRDTEVSSNVLAQGEDLASDPITIVVSSKRCMDGTASGDDEGERRWWRHTLLCPWCH